MDYVLTFIHIYNILPESTYFNTQLMLTFESQMRFQSPLHSTQPHLPQNL